MYNNNITLLYEVHAQTHIILFLLLLLFPIKINSFHVFLFCFVFVFTQADITCSSTKQSVGVIFTRTNFVTLKYVTDSWGTRVNGFRLIITAFKDPCKYFFFLESESVWERGDPTPHAPIHFSPNITLPHTINSQLLPPGHHSTPQHPCRNRIVYISV